MVVAAQPHPGLPLDHSRGRTTVSGSPPAGWMAGAGRKAADAL